MKRCRSHWATDLFCRNAGLCYGHATPRQKGTPGETSDAAKPRPNPHHHVGSLPRNDTLTDLLIRREAGEAIDAGTLDAEMDKAVSHVVAEQKKSGIDIGNDGEQQRVGFQTYVPERMSGFAGESKRKVGRDFAETPELVEQFIRRFPKRGKISNAPQAQAEIKYHDLSQIRNEIARFRRCAPKGTFLEEFATAPSPGIVATTLQNVFYDSHEKNNPTCSPANCARNIWRSMKPV